MTYQDHFTLPTTLLEQVAEQGLDFLPELIRTLQISLDYFRLTQAINRIRRYYIEMAPQAESYFSFPHFDDSKSVQLTMMPFHSPHQGLASTPGPVIMINSFLLGAFVSILSVGTLSLAILPGILIGLVGLVLAFFAHIFYINRVWNRGTRDYMEARFPAPEN